ncbi:MAG TPA: MBL fold metallo-hydrolase [Rhizobacter sp.]|nr:MBL fold metallo-hydrolase [Rhizobacter sp.]
MQEKLLRILRQAGLAALVTTLASCASVPPVSLESAAEALKVADTKAISFAGTGSWYQFGQAPAPGTAWPAFAVSRFSADIDYATAAARVQITRRQVNEPGRERPAPVDQQVDQYVAGTQAWNRSVTAPTAAPTAQPAAVAERAAEIWSTPQGFLKAAVANKASTRDTRNGTEVSFSVGGKTRYVGLLNGKGQVERVQTWIDTPVLGDTLVETRFSDYIDFGGLPFPTKIVRSQGGYPVLDLQVTQVKRNPALSLGVPPEVASAAAPAITVTSTKLADGVYYLTGGTHHSVLIEQRDHLVLVEAPLNEARSLAVIAKSKEIAPNKPIKYLVNSHVHFDHSGGVRTLVDEGAIIVTHQANKAYYEQAWAAPRTLNPDRLSASGKAARFETFSGKHVLTDGRRSIEVIEIAGSGHNDAFALVYLPAEKILIEADAYTPTAANVPVPTPLNPYTVNLYQNVQKLGLDVAQIAALHGPRVVTLADLRAAAGATTTAQR